jgi:uncharacterized protein YfeS
MKEIPYGINKEHASKRAIELIPYDFFWDNSDELAPFGSDEGDTALAEYREWRLDNPDRPIIECLKWIIKGLAEMELEQYNASITTPEFIAQQLEDDEFDDDYFIYTLDATLIATGFAQLVDSGFMDKEALPVIQTALTRQLNWAGLDQNDINCEYIKNLKLLEKILHQIYGFIG